MASPRHCTLLEDLLPSNLEDSTLQLIVWWWVLCVSRPPYALLGCANARPAVCGFCVDWMNGWIWVSKGFRKQLWVTAGPQTYSSQQWKATIFSKFLLIAFVSTVSRSLKIVFSEFVVSVNSQRKFDGNGTLPAMVDTHDIDFLFLWNHFSEFWKYGLCQSKFKFLFLKWFVWSWLIMFHLIKKCFDSMLFSECLLARNNCRCFLSS